MDVSGSAQGQVPQQEASVEQQGAEQKEPEVAMPIVSKFGSRRKGVCVPTALFVCHVRYFSLS